MSWALMSIIVIVDDRVTNRNIFAIPRRTRRRSYRGYPLARAPMVRAQGAYGRERLNRCALVIQTLSIAGIMPAQVCCCETDRANGEVAQMVKRYRRSKTAFRRAAPIARGSAGSAARLQHRRARTARP